MNQIALFVGNDYLNLPAPIERLDNSAGFLGQNIINTSVELLFVVAAVFSLFFTVYGGFKWIMSQGDAKKITSARNTIMYSLIGLSLILSSFIIISLLSDFFNVPLLGNVTFNTTP